MTICFRSAVVFLPVVLATVASSLLANNDSQPEVGLRTVAESSNYRATANGGQVESYLRRLASDWDAAEMTTLGHTTEGRPIWALIVEPIVAVDAASDAAPGEDATPPDASRADTSQADASHVSGDAASPSEESNATTTSAASKAAHPATKPVTVLVLGGIHSGECDGKEASLALARDMAEGELEFDWQHLRLIFVPNFNADGNERRGKLHRPRQEGPDEGMGVGENAQGLDLNRDFIKLESSEVRALVSALNNFNADVLIDTHTTNGSLHGYQLTYDIPHNPATPEAIDTWLRDNLIPALNDRMRAAGFETFYYGNFDEAHRRWETYGHQPRYSTEYMGLRGRIGILSESYSYIPYKTRIDVSYAMLRESLQLIAERRADVRRLIDEAASSVGPGSSVPVAGEPQKTADDVRVHGFQTDTGEPPQPPYDAEALATHEPKDYSVDLWNSYAVKYQVDLPWAYALDQQYAWAIGRLMRHGIDVHRLTEAIEIDGQAMRVESVERSREFQGHELLSIKAASQSRTLELRAGSFVIRTAQPLAALIAYCLEPESDDSLATWNFFEPDVIEGQDFPVQRIAHPIEEAKLARVEEFPATEMLTLERLMHPDRKVDYDGRQPYDVKWLKDRSEYVLADDGRFSAIDAATGGRRPIDELNGLREKLASLEAFDRSQAQAATKLDVFSDDWTHALVSHNQDLFFYDAAIDVARQVTHTPDQEEQLAELSPTGEHVAFVRDNDLWLVDCETTELKRLTDDGSDEVLNGILDWVYQEELYGRGNFKGFWWSPESRRIAFLRLDQSPVPTYQVADSTSFVQQLEATRYPKAGQPLPTATVSILDIESGARRTVDISSFPADDRLIGRVSWSPDEELWLQVLNRVQNRHDLLRVDPRTGNAISVVTEMSPGWIEIRGVPHFLPDGDFLWLSDLPHGRTHLFRVDAQTGKRTQLTSGDWDVSTFESLSADARYAFVTGNLRHPTERHLVAVDLKDNSFAAITSAPGTHRVSVHGSGKYFIDVFSGLGSPPYASLHSIDGQLLRVIDAPVNDRYEALRIRDPKLVTIAARDGFEMQAMIMLPPDLDEDEPDRRLPVLFYVYGGPQSPTVRNSWAGRNYWWHQYLCQQGYAVVLCDNRSALGRGVQDTWNIRGDMGSVELRDLTDAVEWVKRQTWADPERLGVWGWSYGGYFTAYALTHSDMFKAGIAGAPVTDWRNYDAIYTERYMDLPDKNEEGYQSSSVVEAAKDLSGHLLILHGEIDDNVHMSNSLQLAHALQKAGKPFEMMIYPKNRHGIVDPEQRYHMYRLMTDFLNKSLKAE